MYTKWTLQRLRYDRSSSNLSIFVQRRPASLSGFSRCSISTTLYRPRDRRRRGGGTGGVLTRRHRKRFIFFKCARPARPWGRVFRFAALRRRPLSPRRQREDWARIAHLIVVYSCASCGFGVYGEGSGAFTKNRPIARIHPSKEWTNAPERTPTGATTSKTIRPEQLSGSYTTA